MWKMKLLNFVKGKKKVICFLEVVYWKIRDKLNMDAESYERFVLKKGSPEKGVLPMVRLELD